MKFSVITVAWNAAATIRDTMASVAAQQGVDCEHIVVDGGSTDGTLEIVRSFDRPHLRVISEPDNGIYDAMGKGMRLATGDMVGFLNADDFYCRTDSLALLAEAMKANPEYQGVAAGLVIVDPQDPARVKRSYESLGYRPWMASFGHMVPHPAVYVKRDAAERVGDLDPSFKISGDFDWLSRLMFRHGFKLKTIGATVTVMRHGGVSTRAFASIRQGNREMSRSLRANGIRSFKALVWSKYLFKSLQLLKRPSDYPAPPEVRWPR